MEAQIVRSDKSIEEIIQTYQKMIYKIALTHTKNKADAEDAFQQTFLIYFAKNRTFTEEDHRKAWLIRTAVNCSKKITDSTWRKKTVPLEESAAPDSRFQFASEEENLVYQSVVELPEKYRTVIFLYYFEEMSSEEIASVLKRKAGTVRMQLLRGRALLRQKLEGDEPQFS